jgi:hypothetical protein
MNRSGLRDTEQDFPDRKNPTTGVVSVRGRLQLGNPLEVPEPSRKLAVAPLPTSIPAALGCTTSNPGSSDRNSRVNSFLCFRFILPAAIVRSPWKMDLARGAQMNVKLQQLASWRQPPQGSTMPPPLLLQGGRIRLGIRAFGRLHLAPCAH